MGHNDGALLPRGRTGGGAEIPPRSSAGDSSGGSESVIGKESLPLLAPQRADRIDPRSMARGNDRRQRCHHAEQKR